jgi:OmcA/MtrC family decaheme c-type cytochrome
LQGYFTQISPAQPRHAISVVKAVTGDAVRRTVVDSAKCANCHEWFEGHGGNRNYEIQVCTFCHVPGLATSGRGIADATLQAYAFTAADVDILNDWKFDKTATNAALKFPVTSNNLKDMIHGIHSGMDRVTPFLDARDRTSSTPPAITLLNYRRMGFPGTLSKCTTCHVSSTSTATTYNTVPANTLVSTYESIDAAYAAAITGGTATPAIAKTALNTANATDIVTTPFSAACVSCHDAASTKSHMALNGGVVNGTRAAALAVVESCATCHGVGKAYDPAVVHN